MNASITSSSSASRNEALLRKLPEDLAEDPFWKYSHTHRPTTFGAASRRLSLQDLRMDRTDDLKKEAGNWEATDSFNSHHGRLQVTKRWGTLASAPPGGYDPNPDLRSKMPNAPNFKFCNRPRDTFFEEVQFARKNPLHLTRPKSSSQNFGGKKSHAVTLNEFTGKPNDLQAINIEDMRKALLPAPGQYHNDSYTSLRFHKSPMPLLRPEKNRGKPRPVLDFSSLELVTDRNAGFKGSYGDYKDPTLKSAKAYSLGAKRDYTEREYIRVGPGDYNEGPPIGSPTPLGPASAHPHMQPLPDASSMRRGLSTHSFGRKNLLR